MAENSKIQWTHHTFNPWRGCQKVSSGCDNCYAETMSKRNPGTLGVWGPNGTRVVASEAQWRLPHKWNREAEAAGERRRVFCASLADVFEDWDGCPTYPDGSAVIECETWCGHWGRSGGEGHGDCCEKCGSGAVDMVGMDHLRQRVFKLIIETPWLDWLLLTKRPENILRMVPLFDAEDPAEWWPNVWIGTSVENQEQVDKRIPELLRVPAAVRFLSMEPLLGPVDLMEIEETRDGEKYWWSSMITGAPWGATLDWVIVGGESGPNARPCDLEWIRSIRDQCQAADVPVFVKQLGTRPREKQGECSRWPVGAGVDFNEMREKFHVTYRLRDKKGGDPSEWPEDLRVRKLPKGTLCGTIKH